METKDGLTPLHFATLYNNIAVAQLLIEKVDINARRMWLDILLYFGQQAQAWWHERHFLGNMAK